jgi:hypothetical protein
MKPPNLSLLTYAALTQSAWAVDRSTTTDIEVGHEFGSHALTSAINVQPSTVG